jgi:hypothetical protein
MANEMRRSFKASADPTDHATPRPEPSKDRPEHGEHLPTMPDPTQNDPEGGRHVPSIDPTDNPPVQIDEPRPRSGEDSEIEKKWAWETARNPFEVPANAPGIRRCM